MPAKKVKQEIEEFKFQPKKDIFQKKASVMRDKVEIASTQAFNAEQKIKFKKAHTERLNPVDSSYDIEEIPIYSGRKLDLKE
jgi:hypothetical protein